MKVSAVVIAALLLGMVSPAMAQMPGPPGEMPDGPGGGPGGPGGPHRRMFASMSDTGRSIMMNAMRAADPRANRQETMAARDRMLSILDADRLDVGALRRAMDDERVAATAAKTRHQAALLAGFQQLSVADRRAFVADARAMQSRVEARMSGWRGGGRNAGGRVPPQR